MPSKTAYCRIRKIDKCIGKSSQDSTNAAASPQEAIDSMQVSVLFMVQLVSTDNLHSLIQDLQSDTPRPVALHRLYTRASLSWSVDDERKQRLGGTRSIGTRHSMYPCSEAQKTTSNWLPVKGALLFVQSPLAFDEVRVAISALVLSGSPEESLGDELIYKTLTHPWTAILCVHLHQGLCLAVLVQCHGQTVQDQFGYYYSEETLVRS